MSVEFIGFITNNNSSETIVRSGPVLDPPYIETVAKAHELAGFDRALLAFHSTIPDALQVCQHVLGVTTKLKVMIAQRPGLTVPALLTRARRRVASRIRPAGPSFTPRGAADPRGSRGDGLGQGR